MTELEHLESICGNKERARVILAAVRDLVRDEQRLTAAAVDARCYVLPGWTEPGDDEVAAALAVIEAEADAHVARLESAATEPEGNEEAAVKSERPAFESGDRDAALARVRESTRALADARTALTIAGDRHRALRAVAAAAIEAWQRGLPRTTFRQALMEVSATQRATKQQRKERTAPGPSRIDRERFYGRGGDAADFVRSRFVNGGSRHGALPMSRLRGRLDLGGTAPMPKR